MWGNYTLFAIILNPFFGAIYTPSEISVIGMVFIFSGFIGCIIGGIYIDKTRNFKLCIRVLCWSCFAFYALGVYVVSLENFIVLSIASIFLGITNVPILPSSYQFTVLVCQPIPPPVVNGFMMTCAQLYGFLLSFAISPLCEVGQVPVMVYYASSQLISAIASIFLVKGAPKDKYPLINQSKKSED